MVRQPMPISSRWFQGALLTYLVGFTVLGILAYLVYRDQPPIPERVVSGNEVLFTRDDIVGGMNIFQRYGGGPRGRRCLLEQSAAPTCSERSW